MRQIDISLSSIRINVKSPATNAACIDRLHEDLFASEAHYFMSKYWARLTDMVNNLKMEKSIFKRIADKRF